MTIHLKENTSDCYAFLKMKVKRHVIRQHSAMYDIRENTEWKNNETD